MALIQAIASMAGSGPQGSRSLSKSCVLLIVIAGMERFAFKGVLSNLVNYLTDIVGLSNSSAAKMVSSWSGLTSIMPLLVAPLVDSYWNRFSTILACSFIYVLGLMALTSTALALSWSSSDRTTTSSYLFWSLCLISLGQGGCNPALQAFGTDQLEGCEDQELPNTSKKDSNNKSSKKSFFFRMWYFGVCTGSLLGIIVMSFIEDNFGWVIGFTIPTLLMLASIFFFLSGTRIYTYKDSKEVEHRPIERIVRAIKAAASSMKKGGISLVDEKSDAIELELQEKPLCHDQGSDKEVESFEEKPKNQILANIKVVLRLLPIWTMLLMFAVIFQQPTTFFTKQGMMMDRRIGGGFKIPAATLQSLIAVSIILLMPLYDVLFIPIARLITRQEKGLSVTQRMGIGMVMSVMSMVLAALVETKRLEISHKMGVVDVPLSIFWLLPQYIVLGIADIFTVVGMQEFFYNEVPVRMRTMGFALYTSVFGVGSFMSALLIWLVEVLTRSGEGGHGWFSDDMREARLDKYYWLLAILSSVSMILYAILCRYHKNRTEVEIQECT